ncbi:hypothetical protein J6590_089421 [Homalodisca vitripennis]|nr:hypothetical protein J6590_089421 [Homalodisca vitripennis]
MEAAGIRGVAPQWFKSSLIGRPTDENISGSAASKQWLVRSVLLYGYRYRLKHLCEECYRQEMAAAQRKGNCESRKGTVLNSHRSSRTHRGETIAAREEQPGWPGWRPERIGCTTRLRVRFYLTQFLTGHGSLRLYLFKMELSVGLRRYPLEVMLKAVPKGSDAWASRALVFARPWEPRSQLSSMMHSSLGFCDLYGAVEPLAHLVKILRVSSRPWFNYSTGRWCSDLYISLVLNKRVLVQRSVSYAKVVCSTRGLCSYPLCESEDSDSVGAVREGFILPRHCYNLIPTTYLYLYSSVSGSVDYSLIRLVLRFFYRHCVVFIIGTKCSLISEYTVLKKARFSAAARTYEAPLLTWEYNWI